MRPLNQIKAFLLVFVVFLLLFMTSCSVEDYYEEDVSTPLKPIQEGTLYDKSPIDGVHYKTETQEGVTSSGGKFYFREDEAITFSIGDPEDKASIILAQEVKPYTEMTTVNFVPETIKIENNKVTNLSILLQSLDSATNEDTMEITQAVTDAILNQYKGQSMIIDFDQSPNDFIKDTQVNDIFTKINDPDIVNESITRTLPKEEEVVEVQKSLKNKVSQIVAKNIGEVKKDVIAIKTNINKYPLAFYVQNAELMTIKQTTEIPSNSSNISTKDLALNIKEFHLGFRHDVSFSEPGKYTYEIKATQYDHIIAEKIIEISYDPDLAKRDTDFQNHTLIYSCTPYNDPQETFVIDLDAETGINNNKGVILGVIDGIDIVAATNNKNYIIDKYENNDVEGYYLVDKKGYVYRSSDYKMIELNGNLLQNTNIINEDGLGSIKVISKDKNVIKCIAGRLKIIIYEGFIKIVEPSGYIKIIDTGNLDLKIDTDEYGNVINQDKEIIIAEKNNNLGVLKLITKKADVINNDVIFGSQKQYFEVYSKAKVKRIIPDNGIIKTVINGDIDVDILQNKDVIIVAKNSDNTIYLETDKSDLSIEKNEIIGDTRYVVITDSSDYKYYTIISSDVKTDIHVNKNFIYTTAFYSRDMVKDIIPPGAILKSSIAEEITPELLDFSENKTVKIIGANGDNILYIKTDKYNLKMKNYINTEGLKTITIYENFNTESVKDDIILFTIQSQRINTYILDPDLEQPIVIEDNLNAEIVDFGIARLFIDVDGNFKIEDKYNLKDILYVSSTGDVRTLNSLNNNFLIVDNNLYANISAIPEAIKITNEINTTNENQHYSIFNEGITVSGEYIKSFFNSEIDVNNNYYIFNDSLKKVVIDNQSTIKLYGKNIYYLSQKDLFFEPLSFENKENYPIFSPDDTKCMAGSRVIEFFSNKLLDDSLPFNVDSRKVTPWFHDNKLTYGVIQKVDNSTKSVELLKTINLSDYSVQSQTEIIIENLFMRAEWAHLSVAPNRTLAFLTTYSEYFGAIDIINIENNTTNIEYNKVYDTTTFKYDAQKNDALSDRIGKIEFSIDGNISIIGSYGHPEYGGGGLYLLDANTGQRLSKYAWADYQIYGANQVSIDKDDGLIYASARYEVQYEGKKTETSRSKRGIIVLKLKEDNTLEYIKNYYFHSTNDSVQFIKQ